MLVTERERRSTYSMETVELRVHSTGKQTHSVLFPVIIDHFKCLSPHYTYGNRDPRIQMLTQDKVHLQFPSLRVWSDTAEHREVINDNTEYNLASDCLKL